MSSISPPTTTSTKPLSFMEKLGPLVFSYRPHEAASTSADHHQPRLIIISSWTDAKEAHIAKHIAKYKSLYSGAQILLLKSTMSCIVCPSQIGPAMKVAASAVRAAFQTPVLSPLSPLLIHIFSNGGSSSITNLYEQYAATAGPNDDKRLPPHVTIFDSCPGRFHIHHAVAYVSVDLPLLQQLIAAPFLYAFAICWSASVALGLIHNSVGSWYKSHNEDVGNTAEIRRVYIYSASDAITEYKDVEAHAVEAKTRGFSVSMEKYEGSAHVSHVRKDADRYRDIVKRIMKS
ncbi:hypothetical protein BS50DRAFT_301432 [Corynespora cassiicola Philippines]|uniref:Indole-diterpene biosynthesis protein-like protein PaxU n=1 Tax=Corynespora cassiicola Philippines TaxID=1448308 RepID=A0A2T2NX08_CORCC|nr:hypothetical protein BS50DRAFT_301432 [Corynespora cassiicola Philippines]